MFNNALSFVHMSYRPAADSGLWRSYPTGDNRTQPTVLVHYVLFMKTIYVREKKLV